MVFCLPASLGIEVPPGAISEREPPWWESVILFVEVVGCRWYIVVVVVMVMVVMRIYIYNPTQTST